MKPPTALVTSRSLLTSGGFSHSHSHSQLLLPLTHRKLLPPVLTPSPRRGYVTVFGYTQAKALIYSEHGQPKDVLQ